MKYREPTKAPCNDCPFRKKAMPGWLGAASPQDFIDSILHEDPLPCHQTINYDDPDWKAKWESAKTGKMCAGALIHSANIAKAPRDPAFPRMPADRETVFATPRDFLHFHESARVRSWQFALEVRPKKK